MAEIRRDAELYKQVRNDIREKIASGEYAPGDSLPSEPALAEDYGVSRTTVRLALNSLRAEGALGVRMGKGSYVLEQASAPAVAVTRSTADPAESLTPQTTPDLGQTEADVRTAALLGISEADPVFVREDTYTAEPGRRLVLIRRILPFAAAEGTPLETAPFPDRPELIDILTSAHGKITEAEYVRARMSTADDAVRLTLDDPAVILEITRVASAKARPVFAEIERRTADGIELGYRLR
jgi:GntR family transcriptional regulator